MLYYPRTRVEIEVLRSWVISRLEGPDQFTDGYAMGIVEPLEDGDAIIRAVLIFSNYSGKNVFVSGASETNGFLAPTEVAKALMTPFLPPLSVLRMTALVSETNKRSADLMKAFGFVHEGTLRDYEGEGTQTLVYGLTKTDFFGGRYGRKCKTSAVRYESNYSDGVGDKPVLLDVCGHHDGDGESGDRDAVGPDGQHAPAGLPMGSGERPVRTTP